MSLMTAMKAGLLSARQAVGVFDLYFSDVAVLLDGAGAAAGTSFTDLSSNGFTVTPSGNAQTNGSGQILLDGTGDFLSLPSNVIFDFGGSNIVVEAQVNFDTLKSRIPIFASHSDGTAGGYFFATNAAGYLELYDGTTELIATVAPLAIGTDYFLQWVIQSGTLYGYINGVLVMVRSAASLTRAASVQTPRIGRIDNLTSVDLDGTIDKLRITVGNDRDERAPDTFAYTDLSYSADLIGFWDAGAYSGSGNWLNAVTTPADGEAQATYDMVPYISAGFVGTANGMSHNEYMSVPSGSYFGASAATTFTNAMHHSNIAGWTLIAVLKSPVVGTEYFGVTVTGGGAGNRGFYTSPSASQTFNAGGFPITSGMPNYSGPIITGWTCDPAAGAGYMTHYMNGIQTTNANAPTTDTSSTADCELRIGSLGASDINIHALMLVDRPLTEAEVQEFVTAIGPRVGVVRTVPGNYPTTVDPAALAGWSKTVLVESWSYQNRIMYRNSGPGTYGQIRYEKAITSGDGQKQFEIKVLAGSGNFHPGVVSNAWTAPGTAGLGASADAWALTSGGSKYNNGAATGLFSALADNDVIGIIVDGDTGKIWFAKNGTWDGDPVAGTGEAFTMTGTSWYPALYHASAGQYSEIHSTEAELEHALLSSATALE